MGLCFKKKKGSFKRKKAFNPSQKEKVKKKKKKAILPCGLTGHENMDTHTQTHTEYTFLLSTHTQEADKEEA